MHTSPDAREEARRERKLRLVSGVGGRVLDGLLATCRVQTEGDENFQQFWREGKPTVFTLWHGRLLPCTWHHRGQGVVTIISQHRDGEYIARVVERWGYETVRGSSSRGGTGALRELMRWVRRGRSLAITPDGPRGPREEMKLGPLYVAQRTGAPIIPTAGAASRAWFFGSWDRFLVPQPFATMRIVYGEPFWVPRESTEEDLNRLARELEERMAEVKRRAGGAQPAR